MTKVSILNLVSKFEGEENHHAFQRAVELAQYAESKNFERYWVAEHHNFPGVLSSATDLVLSYLAQQTETLRLGAGGVMMPNHTPLQVAERYGTLANLYGDRFDLGVGRAPGTDEKTARLIYHGEYKQEGFRDTIDQLRTYLDTEDKQGDVAAYPGVGTQVPIYILGSSTSSAHTAAQLGLPYSFAGHFSPNMMKQAIQIYRDEFQPSETLKEPYVILGLLLNAAETDEEADLLFSAAQLNVLKQARGEKHLSAKPDPSLARELTSVEKFIVKTNMGVALNGGPERVKDQWLALKEEIQPDEVIAVTYLGNIDQLKTAYDIFYEVVTEN